MWNAKSRQEEYKGTEKRKGNEQLNRLKRAMAKKETSRNVGFCACSKLKYFTFLYLILFKSIRLVKRSFLSKSKAILASWQPRNWFNDGRRHFWGKFGTERVNILLYTPRPSPYRGLVYADLNHSTTSNTGPVKTEFPNVYADIDYPKTDKACSRLPEEHLNQTTEYNDPE